MIEALDVLLEWFGILIMVGVLVIPGLVAGQLLRPSLNTGDSPADAGLLSLLVTLG